MVFKSKIVNNIKFQRNRLLAMPSYNFWKDKIRNTLKKQKRL